MKLIITPCPKPRMTRSDKWKKRPAVLKYFAFCDELRMLCAGRYEIGDEVYLKFHIKTPDSWSVKKKLAMLGKPHQQKPDCDNMIKAFCDALSKEDSNIHTMFAKKVWASMGMIEILDKKSIQAELNLL
tara:strand:+ start:1101 stop:1487 length:387 start_codon:yes stop_codon:yes gene_type:complete